MAVINQNSGTENLEAFGVTYNNQSYRQIIGAFRVSEKDKPAQKDIKYDIYFANDSVISLDITSDVDYPILVGEMIYEDSSLDQIPNLIPDGYTFINIIIQRTENFQISESFTHVFILEDIEIVNKETNTFRLTLKSVYWYMFNNFLTYSSIDENKDYATMLKDVLTNKFITVDSSYRKSLKKGDFITPSNTSLFETVEDLLQNSLDKENGIYFLQYNHMEDKFYIRDIKTQYKEYDESEKSFNLFALVGTDSEVNSRMVQIRNFTNKKEITMTDYTNSVKDFKTWTFDYLKGGYVTKEYKLNNIKDYFPKSSRNDFNVDFKSVPNAIPNDVRNDHSERLGITFENKMPYTKIFMLNNVINFLVDGFLLRKAGDVSLIDVAKDDPYKYKYFGLWFIGRIKHRFSTRNKVYENEIWGCRIENMKKTDKNKKIEG